jgi:UDP-glucose 4-epimerase
MKIVVTGGSGFLGTHLCKALLAEGHDVLNLDLEPSSAVKTVQLNIMDKSDLSRHFAGAEAVFHLASWIQVGESVEKPEEYIKNNILGTLYVLDAMREQNVKKFLFSSSAAIYGEPVRTPIFEDDRTLPTSPYGMTKLAMEGLVSSYCYSYGMTGVALRYFNLYGPGENHKPETHAIPRFIRQIMNDEEVTVWGDGSNVRDYIYIEDVVRAHLSALKLESGYHYMNLSGENETTVFEIIQTIGRLLGKDPLIKHFPPRAGDPLLLSANADKAKKVLSWQPEYSVEKGLEKTVEWFKQNSL